MQRLQEVLVKWKGNKYQNPSAPNAMAVVFDYKRDPSKQGQQGPEALKVIDAYRVMSAQDAAQNLEIFVGLADVVYTATLPTRSHSNDARCKISFSNPIQHCRSGWQELACVATHGTSESTWAIPLRQQGAVSWEEGQ